MESWKILIIDDNPENRAEIRRWLLSGSERRYQFMEAETGAAGRQLCQDGGVDCVVLDYTKKWFLTPVTRS